MMQLGRDYQRDMVERTSTQRAEVFAIGLRWTGDLRSARSSGGIEIERGTSTRLPIFSNHPITLGRGTAQLTLREHGMGQPARCGEGDHAIRPRSGGR